MRVVDFPDEIRPHLLPRPSGEMTYRCLECEDTFPIESLLYTCPECKSVLMLEDCQWDRLILATSF